MRLKLVLFALVFVSAATLAEGHGWWTPWWQRLKCSGWFPGWFSWSWLNVEKSEYSSERIPEMRTIIGQCKADVGRCPVGSCTTKPYSFCPKDGYICPETETRQVECVFGVQMYQYVKRCVCCKDNGIVVKGTVLDAATNEPLKKMVIRINRWWTTYTKEDGTFEKSKIKSNIRSLIVRAVDRYGNYMEAVKIVDIAEGFRGPVEVNLQMIKKAEPVQVNSTVDTMLSLSDEPLNPLSGNTFIEIQANSFRDRWGRLYNGQVNASVTFIDPLSESEAATPGRFLTQVGNTLEPLITDGIVSFNFKSEDGQDLRLSEPVKFIMREDMKVWILNSNTGLWETARYIPRRGKRQVSLDDIISIESDRWYNIDKIPGAPKCYFKGRIFNETSGDEITSSNTATFRPEITAYTYLQQRLRLYAGYTNTPNNTCYEVRCPVVSNPNNSLAGFINMSSTEVISVGGVQLPYITYLTPRFYANYDASIQPWLADVQYVVAPNDLDIFVNFVSNAPGPFYTDRSTCEASSISEPAFHFFKPDPPSYLPIPDDSDICTARIVFKDQWYFYNYTANATNLPNVTGISVWEQDGSDYYYTDVTQMAHVSAGNDSFVFICLKYRCSQANESTTVYLDIDIPTINVTYNYTHPNGSVRNYTYSTKEFFCYGNHGDSSVFANKENEEATSFEGSFIAPENVGSGPDFYNTATSNCTQEADSQIFAYEFFCSRSTRGFEFGNPQ